MRVVLGASCCLMQLILPFDRFAVSNTDAANLWLANAGDYAWKKHSFYPFKTAFCEAHGVPDGFDVQRLVLHCHGCDGTGIWSRWAHYADICNRCNGTGVYRRDTIALKRWIVGGFLFHQPIRDYYPAHPKEEFNAKLKHPDVNCWDAARACLRLFWEHDRERFWRVIKWHSTDFGSMNEMMAQLCREISGKRVLIDIHKYDDVPF